MLGKEIHIYGHSWQDLELVDAVCRFPIAWTDSTLWKPVNSITNLPPSNERFAEASHTNFNHVLGIWIWSCKSKNQMLAEVSGRKDILGSPLSHSPSLWPSLGAQQAGSVPGVTYGGLSGHVNCQAPSPWNLMLVLDVSPCLGALTLDVGNDCCENANAHLFASSKWKTGTVVSKCHSVGHVCGNRLRWRLGCQWWTALC